eukprot:14721631-Alexandrium_andersonii.AAC.1
MAVERQPAAGVDDSGIVRHLGGGWATELGPKTRRTRISLSFNEYTGCNAETCALPAIERQSMGVAVLLPR